MRNNKKIAVLLSACFLIGVLSGCGDKTEQKTDADVTQTEEKETQTEIVTEKEEKALPWAEQNGLSFQESNEFSILAYTTCYTSEDYVEESTDVECKQQNADYSFTTSVASDENGNDVYTVELKTNIPLEIKVINNDFQSVAPFYSIKNFKIMDYYTGTVLPDRDLSNEDKFELKADVEWEGQSYPLSYSIEQKEPESSEYVWVGDDVLTSTISVTSIYTITVPHGYDGLVLGIDSRGIANKILDTETVSDAHIFGEQEDESISDYMFFKVTK